MDRESGKPLSGMDHLRQSLIDILMTAKGSRVMRRAYGSDVARLLDQPVNAFFAVDLYMAVAQALKEYEPRLKLNTISYTMPQAGCVEISFDGLYMPSGKPIKMEGLVLQ
ncbi:GPW/gp25 family protein [Bartonella sp. DGB2]|uniref:GPW/gp25 family protein n=2 Tax=Bartonella sp. DGB2 TaxID=3388426 RepID=UPI00398FF988